MTPQDKEVARELLQGGRLTVDQVGEIKAECEASGRAFLEVAFSRGLLATPKTAPKPLEIQAPSRVQAPEPPPAPLPRWFHPLLVSALLMLLTAWLLSYLRHRYEREQELEQSVQSSRLRGKTERDAIQIQGDYRRQLVEERQARARAALEKGRAALALAERAEAAAPNDPHAYLKMAEAATHLTTYLETNPQDSAVYLERAQAYEMRRNYDKAVEDLERARSIDPSLEPKLRDRIEQLRFFMKRR